MKYIRETSALEILLDSLLFLMSTAIEIKVSRLRKVMYYRYEHKT